MDTSIFKWSEGTVHLKDLASVQHSVPAVVRVTKGQYRNIGVSKSVFNELYIHSIAKNQKVLAEGLKIKDSKKIIKTEQKFSLPVTYCGWFEVLSADGKSIKSITSIRQLMKVFPSHCLVRANTKAITESAGGDLTGEDTRIVHTGEQLKLIGDINVSLRNSKGNLSKKKLLRCVDEKGKNLYFLTDAKGMFSPIAGHGNISGVHNIKGLLEKFRFPIIVRLVHGIIPTRLDKPGFAGVFRLISLYDDETAYVCPFKKDIKMVPVSTQEPLKMVLATDFNRHLNNKHVQEVHDRCNKMIKSYLNSIHILVNIPVSIPVSKALENIQKLSSQSKLKHSKAPPATLTIQPESSGKALLPKVEEDILFEEVDDIYQYVRQGGPPPPARPRPREVEVQPKKRKNKRIPIDNPEVVSSSPLPVVQAKFPEDDYWEEPIYERLDKIVRKDAEDELVAAGTTVAVNTALPTLAEEVPLNSIQSTSRSDSGASCQSDEVPDIPPRGYGLSDVLSSTSSPTNTPDTSSTASPVLSVPIINKKELEAPQKQSTVHETIEQPKQPVAQLTQATVQPKQPVAQLNQATVQQPVVHQKQPLIEYKQQVHQHKREEHPNKVPTNLQSSLLPRQNLYLNKTNIQRQVPRAIVSPSQHQPPRQSVSVNTRVGKDIHKPAKDKPINEVHKPVKKPNKYDQMSRNSSGFFSSPSSGTSAHVNNDLVARNNNKVVINLGDSKPTAIVNASSQYTQAPKSVTPPKLSVRSRPDFIPTQLLIGQNSQNTNPFESSLNKSTVSSVTSRDSGYPTGSSSYPSVNKITVDDTPNLNVSVHHPPFQQSPSITSDINSDYIYRHKLDTEKQSAQSKAPRRVQTLFI